MTEKDVSDSLESRVEQGPDDNLKLVPVAESIRYRKRAQSAEKEVDALSKELSGLKAENVELAERLKDVEAEQRLVKKLSSAGSVDVETAVLIAKSRMGSSQELDEDSCIGQLKKEKPHLFGREASTISGTKRTSPVKERISSSQASLKRAAKRAAGSGNRADLQEYLRLRRSCV